MTKQRCMNCLELVYETITAIYNGEYYTSICRGCLGDNQISSGAASFNRRRDWEDRAADTVQPYTASGPNVEFLRLYPDKARKMFSPKEITELERKI
jgi:hypothetical protein